MPPDDEEEMADSTPEEAPPEEPDPSDVRISELEAQVSQLQAALEDANAQISQLSEGLITVTGDADQEPKEEAAPPSSLLGILKQYAS